MMHKNRLQEYTQRSSLQLPIYSTVNEGYQHAPKFRSTVLVDGVQYTSPNTFLHRKEAEQDVARLAFSCIVKKIKDEGCPLVREDTVFCKSILNEFASKMQLQKPTYNTWQPQGLLPVFLSSLIFNGITYTGEIGRTKKEAEQLAARAVILSLMGNSELGTIISEIVKSKGKLYAALHKLKDSNHTQGGIVPISSEGKEDGAVTVSNNVKSVIPQAVSVMHPPHHEFVIPKLEPIVKSKGKLYAALHKLKDSNHTQGGIVPISSEGKEDGAVTVSNNVKSVIPQAVSVMHPPHHEFVIPKLEPVPVPTCEPNELPVAFVRPVIGQSLDAGSSSGKKRKKNKKKANKKVRTESQSAIAAMPSSQASPHPVAS